jgi:DNA invertase Pin-like site-specific DNA recombinase
MKKIVAYYRVSTKKQGESGLGLEGQEACVKQFCQAHRAEVTKSFKEVETGKIAERPELEKAIAHAKRTKATLLVAKLDRLARNVEFTAHLMNTGVDFVACDNPAANKLTIHILAAVAEDEAKRISERTKAALAAYKARGGLLGGSLPQCRNLTDEARKMGAKMGAEANREKAMAAYADLLPLMQEMRGQGASLQTIAARLNEEGHTTRTGKPFSHVQVKFCLDRAAGER